MINDQENVIFAAAWITLVLGIATVLYVAFSVVVVAGTTTFQILKVCGRLVYGLGAACVRRLNALLRLAIRPWADPTPPGNGTAGGVMPVTPAGAMPVTPNPPAACVYCVDGPCTCSERLVCRNHPRCGRHQWPNGWAGNGAGAYCCLKCYESNGAEHGSYCTNW